MNASRKVMEWLICLSFINLMLGCFFWKKIIKKFSSWQGIYWRKLKHTTKPFSSHPFTIACVSPWFLSLFVLFLFAFFFHLLFSLTLTLIIAIFYCFKYTSLLFHLVSSHLLSHLSLSSIIFIISTLIISVFYCLNYTLLLLYLIITHLVNTFYDKHVIKICPRQWLWFI